MERQIDINSINTIGELSYSIIELYNGIEELSNLIWEPCYSNRELSNSIG